jgi:hypothetical protein
MPFTTGADNQSLDALNATFGSYTPVVAYASLHSAYSATGANELSGGSPAYARLALTWSTASGGSKAISGVTGGPFNVPAGQTVAFVGLWSAATSGTFAAMGANGGAAMYAFTAATSGNLFTVPASPAPSYTAGQAVVIWGGVGATTPGGFTAGNIYYVASAPTTSTFTLSATSGGSAVTVSAAGSGLIQAITLETFGAQGTFTLTADTLSIQ